MAATTTTVASATVPVPVPVAKGDAAAPPEPPVQRVRSVAVAAPMVLTRSSLRPAAARVRGLASLTAVLGPPQADQGLPPTPARSSEEPPVRCGSGPLALAFSGVGARTPVVAFSSGFI